MSQSSIIAIIPARFASTRFPGKPLVQIDGKTMIQRVYERTISCPFLQTAIVATDSQQIFDHVQSWNGNVMMTSDQHRSGTERCSEVTQKLLLQHIVNKESIIINVQGDEPFIDTSQIETVARLFDNPSVKIATLRKKITRNDELESPNAVKIVCDKNGKALYFSRFSIPFIRNKETQGIEHWKHIGIYGYRVATLLQLVQQQPSMLETAESLEQLRWLENGYEIYSGITTVENVAIDTPEDLLKIKQL
ncbi:MAG: 3-deoxy-manno-octulosonate cytidylyltransferase [Bacteroidales bacterium]|nr:3-deoxy-manno-octulosonate cytidylyltransferase [Bacteroidales bacterium]